MAGVEVCELLLYFFGDEEIAVLTKNVLFTALSRAVPITQIGRKGSRMDDIWLQQWHPAEAAAPSRGSVPKPASVHLILKESLPHLPQCQGEDDN